jgi:hypothetical protein
LIDQCLRELGLESSVKLRDIRSSNKGQIGCTEASLIASADVGDSRLRASRAKPRFRCE